MIVGNINNFKNYTGLNKRIEDAVEFISKFDFKSPDGRYDIDGDNLFMNLITAEAETEEKIVFEKHKKYIDFHVIISGSEKMFYAYDERCSIVSEYNDEDDYMLLKGETSELNFSTGDFYVLFPEDAHAPGFKHKDKTFRKAILKIKI